MIPVALADEPVTFDATVRQPGLRAMDELAGKLPARSAGRPFNQVADSKEAIPPGRFPPYWRSAIDDLLQKYHRICAYLCVCHGLLVRRDKVVLPGTARTIRGEGIGPQRQAMRHSHYRAGSARVECRGTRQRPRRRPAQHRLEGHPIETCRQNRIGLTEVISVSCTHHTHHFYQPHRLRTLSDMVAVSIPTEVFT